MTTPRDKGTRDAPTTREPAFLPPLTRRVLDRMPAGPLAPPDVVARFAAGLREMGVFERAAAFLRTHLADALAVPIAVAAGDLAVQRTVLAAIDRGVGAIGSDVDRQLELAIYIAAQARHRKPDGDASAFLLNTLIMFGATAAEILVWEDLAGVSDVAIGARRQDSPFVLLMDEQHLRRRRQAYYDARNAHPETARALERLGSDLGDAPLGTLQTVATSFDEYLRGIFGGDVGDASVADYLPPPGHGSNAHVERVRSELFLPRDASIDLMFSVLVGRGPLDMQLRLAPRAFPQPASARVIRVGTPEVVYDPTRVPTNLATRFMRDVQRELRAQFKAAEDDARALGRRRSSPRERAADSAEIRRLALRLDRRVGGWGPAKIARAEAAERRTACEPGTVRTSVDNWARDLDVDLPPLHRG